MGSIPQVFNRIQSKVIPMKMLLISMTQTTARQGRSLTIKRKLVSLTLSIMFNFGGLFSGDNGKQIETGANMNATDESVGGDGTGDTVATGEDVTVGFEHEGASECQYLYYYIVCFNINVF